MLYNYFIVLVAIGVICFFGVIWWHWCYRCYLAVFGAIGVIDVIGVTSGRSDARVSLSRGELGSLSWPRQPLHTLLINHDHDHDHDGDDVHDGDDDVHDNVHDGHDDNHDDHGSGERQSCMQATFIVLCLLLSLTGPG